MHVTLINEDGIVTREKPIPPALEPLEPLGRAGWLMVYALYALLALGVVIMSLIIRLVVG